MSEAAQETSLAEMNRLAEEIAMLRDQESAAAEVKKKITEELEAKEQRVLELLMENELTSYKAPEGTMSLSFRMSAKLPQAENREAFFEYLRKTGRFEDMITVSSQTFNSFVKEQYELAQERGEGEPEIPGVTEVKTIPRLSFRRTR